MDNNKFKYADIKKVCENKLNIEFRAAKEFNGWFILDGKKVARVTIPHGKGSRSKDGIPKGTYKNMAKQLKLTIEQFDKLLNCPLKENEYKEILRKQLLL